MEKRFKFIPALSAGSLFSGIKAGNTFADGTPYDYWNYDDEFRYPYFLVTAGHFYKRKDVANGYNLFSPQGDNIVFGDSGGFQIATGKVDWNLDIRERIFHWLEENSNIAANLDIPIASKIFNYDQCLEISKDNFNYFHEKQSGKTAFLNVLQGYGLDTYMSWYEEVKEFRDFAGWCIGNARFSLSNLVSALYVFLLNNEHKRSKYWHILGASGPQTITALCHIQHALNQIGSEVQIFSDSSSPNSTRFGYYYCDVDWRNMRWNTIHIPYMRAEPEDMEPHVRDAYEMGIEGLPLISKFDRKRYMDLITDEDLHLYNERFSCSLALRNTMYYVEVFDEVQDLVKMPTYYREEYFNKDMAKIGDIINQLAESANDKEKLKKVFKKAKPFLSRFKNKSSSKTNYVTHNFFDE